MRGLFNYDNPFFQTLLKMLNMIVISAMFTIFCIPIFTAGASVTALYYAVQKWLKYERGYAWSCFWESFKSNFKQATLGNLIFLAIAFLMITELSIVEWLGDIGNVWSALKPIFIVILVILFVYAFWYFIVLARFENTMKNQLKNALILMVRHIPTSLMILVIGAGTLLLIYLGPYFVLILPALSFWLISLFTERVFRKHMTEEDRKLEDELNMNYRKQNNRYRKKKEQKGK